MRSFPAHHLRAGPLRATFLPGQGMLGVSLCHHGEELLRRVDRLEEAAWAGSPAGIPLLHPWANRLRGTHYRVGGREIELDPASPLLRFDGNGLPLHGVPWSLLDWEVLDASDAALSARLAWNRPQWRAVFPFEHELYLSIALRPDAVRIATTLVAGPRDAVPVSFGFHPYVGIPGLPREQWRLTLPPMSRLVLDSQRLPTGARIAFEGFDGPLGDLSLDHAFAPRARARLAIAGAGRRICVEWLAGYRYAQVYAPAGEDCIALEPMTAPTSALADGNDLPLVPPGHSFRAGFRIRVETI